MEKNFSKSINTQNVSVSKSVKHVQSSDGTTKTVEEYTVNGKTYSSLNDVPQEFRKYFSNDSIDKHNLHKMFNESKDFSQMYDTFKHLTNNSHNVIDQNDQNIKKIGVSSSLQRDKRVKVIFLISSICIILIAIALYKYANL